MTYTVVPFKRWHFDWLDENARKTFTDDMLVVMEHEKWRTVLFDGDPIMCGGAITHWPGRYQLNAFMNEKSARHMTFLTRATRKFIAEIKGRIEFTVRCDFPAGHRWARMLGFYIETLTMVSFGPEGEAHSMYVRHN